MSASAQAQTAPAEEELVAVFRKNKQRFDDWSGSERTRRINWQRAFGSSMLLCFCLTAGVIYEGTLPKRVVVPVTADPSTGMLLVGHSVDVDSPSAREMTFSNFVEYWRVVTSDTRLQKIFWDKCYHFVGKDSPANKDLDRFHIEHNPETRAKKELVSARIAGHMPLSANSYQVSWEETTQPMDGGPVEKSSWQCIFVYEITGTPKNPDVEADNPAGIFITEIHPLKVNVSKESEQ